MATQWQIGDKVQNRWEIYNVLRGGMGIIYVVFDHETRLPFAAKTFRDDVFIRHPQIAARFAQEAYTWVNLDTHHNVVQAHLIQEIEGKPYIFLEYISGGDLSRWIGTPRLTKDMLQVLRFAIQFCNGMIHILSRGIQAHRDIKPQNCLITEDNVLKVTDLGLAKVFDDLELAQAKTLPINPQSLSICFTRTGVGAGTCTHMAPEQFDDIKRVDVRADIYSFGVMLFQMITGRLPYIGKSWQEFERLHKTQPLPPLDVSHKSLAAFVQKCLAKDPSQRFASFEAVRACLVGIWETLTDEPVPQPLVGTEMDAGNWNNKGVSLDELGRYEEALACYDRALALNEREAIAWSNKGVTLKKLGRVEEAIACYDQAIELYPAWAVIWSNKGLALGEGVGKWGKALECYDRALELDPHRAEFWYNKGLALKVLGFLQEAIVHYDRALELNPRYVEAWCNKGSALVGQRKYEEAIRCLDHALTLNLRLAPAWFNKGTALALSGRPREALVYFKEAQRLGIPQAVKWIAQCQRMLGQSEYEPTPVVQTESDAARWYNEGVRLASLGQMEEALVYFDRALATAPHMDVAWVNRGNVLCVLGRREAALICYEQALKVNPHCAHAWHNKGLVLCQYFQSWQEALVCFEEAQRLGHPPAERAVAKCRRAVVLEVLENARKLGQLGRLEEALVCLEEAERLGFPEVKQAIDFLRQQLKQKQ